MQAAAPLYLQATYRGSIIQLAFSIAQRHEQPPVAPQLNRAQSVLMGHQRKEKTRQDKTRQDKTRQDKTRQDKTRQDKTMPFGMKSQVLYRAAQAGSSIQQFTHAEVAWEEPPPRQMLLRMRDIQPQLQQKWLQLYWPDDSRWWPAQVTEVNPKRHRAHLLYETGAPLQLACDEDSTGCNSC